ncbi:hypothetical protein DFAR_2590035 [Desulfarculales bacterium]
MDWFYVVQLFTTAVGEVPKAEAKERILHKAIRWAVLKTADSGRLTEKHQRALTDVRARLVAHHPPRPPCPEVHSA